MYLLHWKLGYYYKLSKDNTKEGGRQAKFRMDRYYLVEYQTENLDVIKKMKRGQTEEEDLALLAESFKTRNNYLLYYDFQGIFSTSKLEFYIMNFRFLSLNFNPRVERNFILWRWKIALKMVQLEKRAIKKHFVALSVRNGFINIKSYEIFSNFI